MPKFKITLDYGLATYLVDADNKEKAIDKAETLYDERNPEVAHVNRPSQDKISLDDVSCSDSFLICF